MQQQAHPGMQQQAHPGMQQQAHPGLQQQAHGYPGMQQQPTVVVGAPMQPLAITQREKPNDHRGMISFTLLCCCCPVSMFAWYYSTQVNSRWEAGDVEGAEKASRNAGRLWKISIGVGLIFIPVILLLYFLVINPVN
ncbi:uncharacterized protein LOC144910070 [Branchiostoma floridae x Branchiostoma belcheri]